MAQYVKILEIVAQDKAVQGDRVDVIVLMKNISNSQVKIYGVAVVDSLRIIDWPWMWVPAGVEVSFAGAFLMGGTDVTIRAQSWYEGIDGYLYKDDEMTKDVKLSEQIPTFGEFVISDYRKV